MHEPSAASKPQSKEHARALAAWYVQMYEAYRRMSDAQKVAVSDWESEHGHVSNWPGWEPLIGPKPAVAVTTAAGEDAAHQDEQDRGH